jgi:PhzF family phenazine biosynthesis protein
MRIFIVDAFADKQFRGNPAAVCILQEEVSDELKQCIAMEMNLSETAFVIRQGDGFGLRWFTPVSEVELCGHATLASAHILWQEGLLNENEEAVFKTLHKGILKAKKYGKEIVMNFPAEKPQKTMHENLVRNLFSFDPSYLGLAGNHFFVELPSVNHLIQYKPDFSEIAKLPKYGLIITSATSGEYDFVSRFFAPAVGVNEDPVTGSAHCALGPYWAEKLGKKCLRGFQASKRGGIIGVEVEGDRVNLKGNAITFLKGVIGIHK